MRTIQGTGGHGAICSHAAARQAKARGKIPGVGGELLQWVFAREILTKDKGARKQLYEKVGLPADKTVK